MGVDRKTFVASVHDWNVAVKCRSDSFGRPGASMVALNEPPFYCGQIWPVVSNTQGGPRHDPRQRVVNPYEEVIPGLYTAGECGSIWGSLYTAGCNLTECFVTGKIAGEDAARRAP